MHDGLRVGGLYSNDEIQAKLSVGNAGGIRVRLNKNRIPRRIVVLTSTPSARQAAENPYADRVEGDILVYTGGGREGDQSLAGVNKRVPQQSTYDFPIYGFELVESRRASRSNPKRWKFLGLLEYVRHYPDTQLDIKMQLRQVWIFEFRIHIDPDVISPEHDEKLSASLLQESRELFKVENEDREIALDLSEDSGTPEKVDPVTVEKVRGRLLALAPDKFEHLVKELLVVSGFENVAVTKYSQDGGIDVNANVGKLIWPLKDQLLQVQAKRWIHTVGRREVAQLRGSLQPFARGALVTTSHFSKAAIGESIEEGKLPIVLVNGYTLATIVHSCASKLQTLR